MKPDTRPYRSEKIESVSGNGQLAQVGTVVQGYAVTPKWVSDNEPTVGAFLCIHQDGRFTVSPTHNLEEGYAPEPNDPSTT